MSASTRRVSDAASTLGARGDLDPHRGPIFAAEAKQVGAHLAVAAELMEKIDACLVVDEPSVENGRTDESGASGAQPNITRT